MISESILVRFHKSIIFVFRLACTEANRETHPWSVDKTKLLYFQVESISRIFGTIKNGEKPKREIVLASKSLKKTLLVVILSLTIYRILRFLICSTSTVRQLQNETCSNGM